MKVLINKLILVISFVFIICCSGSMNDLYRKQKKMKIESKIYGFRLNSKRIPMITISYQNNYRELFGSFINLREFTPRVGDSIFKPANNLIYKIYRKDGKGVYKLLYKGKGSSPR